MDLSGLFRIDTKLQLLLFAFKSDSLKPLLVQYIYSGHLDENAFRKELKVFLSKCNKSDALKNLNFRDSDSNETFIDFAINTITKKGGLFYLLAHSLPLVNRIHSLAKKISKRNVEKYIENIQSTENDVDLPSTFSTLTTYFNLSSSEKVLLKLTCDGASVIVSEMIKPDLKFAEVFLIAVICGSLSVLDTLWIHEENSERTKFGLVSASNELTALHFAVLTGNVEVIDWLLRKDFMMEAVDSNGDTGLHLAASAGNVEVVEMLINRGGNCNACNTDKKTPLHKAAERGYGDIIDVLMKSNANIEAQNSSGNTPLIGAAENGHLNVLEQLLNYGASIDSRNSKGNSCLHRAAFHGYSEIVEFALSRGAEGINAQNADGKTTLHIAAERGHLNIVKLLIAENADINLTNKFGQTPLHEAAWKGHVHVAERLLENGASGEMTDFKNRTALHEAAMNGHISIVELLLSRSNVNAVDINNSTALHLAELSGQENVVKLIQERVLK